MPFSVRNLIVTIVTLSIAILMAHSAGEGEMFLPVVFCLSVVVCGFYVVFFKEARIEALFLGVLLFINIVTQGGLPKISLAGEAAPLYPAVLRRCRKILRPHKRNPQERLQSHRRSARC